MSPSSIGRACNSYPNCSNSLSGNSLIQARLRAMADAMNTELAVAAQVEDAQDWPPLNHADVVAWSRCVTQMSEMSAVQLKKVE